MVCLEISLLSHSGGQRNLESTKDENPTWYHVPSHSPCRFSQCLATCIYLTASFVRIPSHAEARRLPAPGCRTPPWRRCPRPSPMRSQPPPSEAGRLGLGRLGWRGGPVRQMRRPGWSGWSTLWGTGRAPGHTSTASKGYVDVCERGKQGPPLEVPTNQRFRKEAATKREFSGMGNVHWPGLLRWFPYPTKVCLLQGPEHGCWVLHFTCLLIVV